MIRFLHTGDLHLGLEFKGNKFTAKESVTRRLELWESFERFIDHAIEEDVDFVFLSGDLYEDSYFSLGDMVRFRDILARAAELEILIAAGNHDCIHKDSLYRKVDFTDNVHIFSNEFLEPVVFEELNTIVYGYSWPTAYLDHEDIFKDLVIDRSYENKILLLHGDLKKESNYLPLDLEYLKSLDFDYIALGHIHKPRREGHIVYPGVLESLSFNEIGDRGFVQASLDKGHLSLDFIDFTKRKFFIEKIDIDGDHSYEDIRNKFLAYSNISREKDYYKVFLRGFMDPTIDKLMLFRELELDFHYLDIVDETDLDYDLESLERDNKDNILGRFIGEMRAKGLDQDLNKKALYYGIQALLKEKL